MRVAFFADIHANLPALEAAVADARAQNAAHLINLGDVVGYGPEPAECLARVRELASASLLGNHDAAACGLLDPKLFNAFARETAERAHLSLDAESRAWLRALPYIIEGDGFACAHGSFDAPERFHYLETKEDAALSLAAMPDVPLLVVGHTHLPCVFLQEGGTLRKLPGEDLILRPGMRCVVNPGSVGFPRGDRLTADYLLYDTVTRRLSFRSVVYDLAPYRLALVRNGYNPMNYWFLSPSARRRQTELAFRNPSRAAGMPPKGAFRPRRHKTLPRTAWALLAVLALFIAAAIGAMAALAHQVRRPAPAIEEPAPPRHDGGLLPPLSHWQHTNGTLTDDAYTLAPENPGAHAAGGIHSPLLDVPPGAKRLKLSFLTEAADVPGIAYKARVIFFRAAGTQRMDSLHTYKQPGPNAYTVKVPADAVRFRVLFNISTPTRFTLRNPTLR